MNEDLIKFIQDEKIDTEIFPKTEFEIDSILLGGKAGISPWIKLKNCKKELKSRFYDSKRINRDIKLEQAEIAAIEAKLEDKESDELVDELKIELEMCNASINKCNDQLKCLENETEILKEIYIKTFAEVEELKEKYSDEDLEKDSYVRAFIEEINNQLLANQIGCNVSFINTVRGIADPEMVTHVLSNVKQMICESMVDSLNLKEVAKGYIENAKKIREQKAQNPQQENTPETQVIDLAEKLSKDPKPTE